MPTIYQKTTKKQAPLNKKKMEYVMKEFSQDSLHAGRTGKIVRNPKQAIAIAYSEARKSRLKK